MSEFSVVGKPLPRIDGKPKATGEAQYATDIPMHGCLCGKILRSPHPHARILNIDTSKAMRVTGVKAILTAQDVPNVRFGQWILDETLFKSDRVRYIGDEIAAVAATDEDAAQEALEGIRVDYEALPAVFSPEDALKDDAPLVHEDFAKHKALFEIVGREGNQACRVRFSHGDLTVGFSAADDIIENRFQTHSHHPTYLETHAALATCDSTGNLTVWTTTQGVFKSQELIAKLLELPLTRVRVIASTVGGGFGGKKPRADTYASALAWKTRRPVRIAMSREEDLAATFTRHPAIIDVKTGVRRDGALTAWDFKMLLNTGAYADHGPSIMSFGSFHARGPYKTPHVHIDARLVYTNRSMSGAFRGYGNPQVTFAVESQMDIIARALEMDPLDLRRKNAMGSGDSMVNGQRYPQVLFQETLEQAAKAFGWGTAKNSPCNERKRGIGIACGSHPTGGWSTSATVKMMGDGTIQVGTGAIEIGAGEYTMAAQIAAETLGVPYEKVRVVSADTDGSPHDFFTGASRSTFTVGQAVHLAALDARLELLKRASDLLEAPVEDLATESERVYVASVPERCLTYSEVAKAANVYAKGPIVGKGSYSPHLPPIEPDRVEGACMHEFPAHGFAVHIAEVEVDEETGEVEVVRMICSHDIGQAINRGGLEGQIEGGVTQGIGYALIEEMRFEEGALVNGTLVDYKIPNIQDVPCIEYNFVEQADPKGPYGAKGVGEAVLVPTAPAIANAIYHASGVRVKNLPITPEKVIQSLSQKEKSRLPN